MELVCEAAVTLSDLKQCPSLLKYLNQVLDFFGGGSIMSTLEGTSGDHFV